MHMDKIGLQAIQLTSEINNGMVGVDAAGKRLQPAHKRRCNVLAVSHERMDIDTTISQYLHGLCSGDTCAAATPLQIHCVKNC